MNGVLVVYKPMDFTSFDAVAVTRRASGQRKTGHCGTLDPNATGVLPVLLGAATKAQDILPNHDKEYVAEFRLGLTTDTLDIWGKVITEQESRVSQEELEAVLPRFRGEIMQVPPMYSAIRKNGQRLYDLARQGIEVEREARPVTVYSLNLLSFDETTQSGKIQVSCSKGTYVRTLIDDIGNALRTGAVMTSLCRTSACGFTTEDAVSVEDIKAMTAEEIRSRLLPVERLFVKYRKVSVSPAQATRFKNGGALLLERLRSLPSDAGDNEIFRVKHEDKFLGLAILKNDTKELKIYKLFNV